MGQNTGEEGIAGNDESESISDDGMEEEYDERSGSIYETDNTEPNTEDGFDETNRLVLAYTINRIKLCKVSDFIVGHLSTFGFCRL